MAVILMSASSKEHRNPTLERLAYAWIEKPFDASELLRVLHAAYGTTPVIHAAVVKVS